eukprot:TRINITY_DN659_c0_g1_i1.p1 TRINITY_DN659_c0_g1~~TRINITY_DN659_c0_g1_i1.p1  ORF type:complete len:303 (+),score=60.63 TRINITY_DN659_c0_g1_i1:960-1868(+)
MASLEGLAQLSQLSISHNLELVSIPPLQDLESLTTLNIEGNSLITTLVVAGQGNLGSISIEKNAALKEVDATEEFPVLTSLSIQGNPKLIEAPLLSSMSILERANLANNGLTIVSSDVYAMHTLKTLRLENNDLIELPEGIETLASLEELNIAGNNLEKIPNGLWKLRHLKKLDLSGNSLRDLEEPVAMPFSEGVECHLEENELWCPLEDWVVALCDASCTSKHKGSKLSDGAISVLVVLGFVIACGLAVFAWERYRTRTLSTAVRDGGGSGGEFRAVFDEEEEEEGADTREMTREIDRGDV